MFLVISDIHGCYEEMVRALENWNQKEEHLVILGDLIDRGPDSLKVVRHLMQLKEDYDNVTILKGNHEDMFISWLESGVDNFTYYYNEAHNETLISFLGKERFSKSTRKQRGLSMLHSFKPELRFMRDLPLYLDLENVLFVHAGIDLEKEDWKEDEVAMLWIRDDFYFSKRSFNKKIYFGHTPVRLLHESVEKSNDGIWTSKDGLKIGIDGGVSMGGQLNILRIDDSGEILANFNQKSI